MKRMKKIMMMALMALVAVAAQAKDDKVTVISGDASTLKDGEKTAVIEFDYTKTVAECTPLKQYLKDRGDDHVADWPEIAKTARDRFVKMFNKKNKKGVQIVDGNKADLKMKVIVNKLDFGQTGVSVVFGGLGSAGGAEISGKLVVTDAKSGKKLVEYDLHEIRSNGSTDFTEGKRLGTCYENAAKMIVKESL